MDKVAELIRKIDRKILFFSLLVGIISSWIIRNPITLILFDGKSFSGRNIFYKIFLVLLLIIFFTILVYLFCVLLHRITQRASNPVETKEKQWIFILKGITFLVVCLAVYIAIRYSNQPIIEIHAFRQTQTALTSYWIIQNGWNLAYETPVVGYPWSIPFEFPIFQTIVALIAKIGKIPLDSVGRLVSFCFLLLSIWPIRKIFHKLSLPNLTIWVFCALFLSSPLYLFWGRTFMIETAALFFTLAAIPYCFDLYKPNPSWKSAFWMFFWGVLAVLQKSTTAVPILFVLAVTVLISHIRKNGLKFPSLKKISIILLSFLLPVLIGSVWTSYADNIKSQNMIGEGFTTKALTDWYFGPIQQHFDFSVLKMIIWDRSFILNAAGVFGLLLLLAALFWFEKRNRIIIMCCLALFLLPIFLFTNVHRVHDYYQLSCVIFLICALAISLATLLRTKHALILTVTTLFFVLMNLLSFSKSYAKFINNDSNITNNSLLLLSDLIERYTPEDSAIVVFGKDWSSEFSYYSHRKSLTVPDEYFDVVWNNPSMYLGGLSIGAMVMCENYPHPPDIEQFLERPEILAHPTIYRYNSCYLWMPEVDGVIYNSEDLPFYPIEKKQLQGKIES